MFAAFMDMTREKVKVGYDRRKYELPLKGRSLEFENSENHPQLQVADIVASSVSYWAKHYTSDMKKDYFFHELEKLDLNRLISQHIWPTKDMSPEKMGTVYDGGTHPADHAGFFLMGRNNE